MHISKVVIIGYRNLIHTEIDMERSTVLIGTNESGKSNVIRAIQLALDADISTRERHLTLSDLARWEEDGTTWYMNAVQVQVTISDLSSHPDGPAYFADCLLEPSMDVAALTYTFAPREWDGYWQAVSDEPDISTYRWRITGGRHERSAFETIRDAISVVCLDAVRNPFRDSERWSTSPIRGILARRAEALTDPEKESLTAAISTLFEAVESVDSIGALRTDLQDEFSAISKTGFSSGVHLAATRSEPTSFVRSLRLFESFLGEHPLDYMSTGAQNVLALAVARKELLERVEEKKTALPVLILEEPEAHLHPSMQRAVFSQLLADTWPGSVLVSTHSPALVSVAEPRYVVRIAPGKSQGLQIRSLSSSEDAAPFLDEIAKFLQGTRSELLLARRVLLVEGLAESILLPDWADSSLEGGLDRHGISVVSIEGTHFKPYIAVCRALGIPYCVVTDGDPSKQVTGARRVELIVEAFGDIRSRIFMGTDTLELDLAGMPNNAAAISLAAAKLGHDEAATPAETMKRLMDRSGKGSLATVLAVAGVDAPAYVKSALTTLAAL